jgi:hypothetical protein
MAIAALLTGIVAAGSAFGRGTALAGSTSVTCGTSSSVITCTLPTSSDESSVDVADLVSQLSSNGVTGGTPIWIQAWGGKGGTGAGYNVNASGGLGGYAQTVTTLDDLQSELGVSTLYYYVGNNGNSHGSDTDDTEGGDGGASSVVATEDLTSNQPSINTSTPTDGNVILLAGGGGGGAGESPYVTSVGDAGGAGGVAVASTSSSVTTDGNDSAEKNGSVGGTGGRGGTCPDGGAKGTSNWADGGDGGDGAGGEGGGGGQQSSGHFGSVGWVNVSSSSDLTLSQHGSGGSGGAGTFNDEHGGYNGAGGGGGGGYGGGGGGASTYSGDPGGGGGGCTFAAASLESDILAPTGYQSNPGSGQGAVQLSFDTVNSTATFEVPTPAKAGDSGTFTAHYKVATSSGTKTFYAAGGSLSGAWNGSTDTLSNGSGDIDLESAGGNALTQTVAIDEGASITPESNTDCSSGESQYALDGQIEVTDVPVFGSVSGDADLTGCGSISGTVTYNGSLSNLSPSDITSASVDDLELQMEPVTTLDAPDVESVESPMYADVGCADQACRIRVGGKLRVKGHHGQVFSRPLATKHVHVAKGHSKRVHLRLKWRHHSAVRRLARDLRHRDRARLKIRIRAKGSRGAVGHSRLSIKLRR